MLQAAIMQIAAGQFVEPVDLRPAHISGDTDAVHSSLFFVEDMM